jgi:hypothetical protein
MSMIDRPTFSKDVHGPITPWTLMSFEQFISSVPLQEKKRQQSVNVYSSFTESLILGEIPHTPPQSLLSEHG